MMISYVGTVQDGVEQIPIIYSQQIETFKSWSVEVIVVMCSVGLFLHWIKSVRGS